jgi:hypothetical protein
MGLGFRNRMQVVATRAAEARTEPLPPVIDVGARAAAARQARERAARGAPARSASQPRAIGTGARTAVLASGVNLNPTVGLGPFRLY